jgi:hypothetical protein
MRSSIILFPSKECWLTTGAGKSGLGYVYVILMDSAMRALNQLYGYKGCIGSCLHYALPKRIA